MGEKDLELERLCSNYAALNRERKKNLLWAGEQFLKIKRSLDAKTTASPVPERVLFKAAKRTYK